MAPAKTDLDTARRTLQVALNGGAVHHAMPLTPDQIAADAAACVAAGANLLHLHAYDDTGAETLSEPAVTQAIEVVRARCPGIPISMTTFAQIEPDPHKRLETVSAWTVLPDLIPANQGESGVVELTELLSGRGVGVEACVFTVAEAETLVRRGGAERFRRIVVEPMESDPADACDHAVAMEAVLSKAGVRLEQVHHGMGSASWPVLRQAIARGHGIRTGLEDVDLLPDDTAATGNLALVRAAVDLLAAAP